MKDGPERWIVIPHWVKEPGHEGFQHYSDRDPIWIKNYRSLLSSDEYRDLSFTQRGILHGLWLGYAASNRQLRDDTLALTRRLGQRVTRASLDALNHAGFITFSASKPLAPCYPSRASREESREEKNREQDQNLNQVPFAPSSAHANGHHDDPAHIADAIAQSLAAATQPKGTRIE